MRAGEGPGGTNRDEIRRRITRMPLDAQAGDGAGIVPLHRVFRASYERMDKAKAEIDTRRGRLAETDACDRVLRERERVDAHRIRVQRTAQRLR